MTGIVSLTSWQSVTIYGWWKPLRVLNWKIIADRSDLSVRKLYSMGLNENQLSTMQPDKLLWISDALGNKRIELCDIVLVPSWRIHATKDMHANIVDIARMNLTAEFLHHTGVTFEDLVDAGLTLNAMLLFGFDLTSWVHLGLYRDFLIGLTDVQSVSLFKMPQSYVIQCVKETSGIQQAREESE
jgi:hypothetical protein